MRRRVPFITLAALALLALGLAGVFFIYRGGDRVGDGSTDEVSGARPAQEADEVPGARPAQEVGDVSRAPRTETQATQFPKENRRLQSALGQLAAIQAAGGSAAAAGFASTRGLEVTNGMVTVEIEAAPDSADAAVEAANSMGGKVETTYGDLIQAEVPVERLAELAASLAVGFVREPRKPTIFVTSEGVADIGAIAWQNGGDTGAGVKIAILDPGFAGYQQLVAAGELPADVVTMSFTNPADIGGGGINHGAACAEIVHDVAPGAQLYLVNFSTDVELGNAVDYLIAQGVNVISASWGFFGAFRGDGQGAIDDMVQRANAAGNLWANAAGNAAQNHWSGHFTDTDPNPASPNHNWNAFAPSDRGNDILVSEGSTIDLYLTWDRWPVTDQDYDLYLFWSGDLTAPVAVGGNYQNGSTAPSEELSYTVPPGRGGTYYAEIKNYSATGDANFQLYAYPGPLQYQVAAGSLGGQPTDSPYAMTVGAVPAGGTLIESFSSRGPTIDGRVKPDIVAPDRVSTVTYGYQRFWGTSASAPHAAGAAALMKGANPAYTPAALQGELESRATGLGDPGKDNIYGSGKLNMGTTPDHTPPLVTGVQPSGMIYASSGTVVVDYVDTGSGINPSSVQVTLDGAALTGCIITTSQASCQFSELSAGVHAIGGSVADNAGNSSPISGSFTTACGKPPLSLGAPVSFWASYADYINRELSVTFSFCNTGATTVVNVTMVGSSSTNGALPVSPMPATVGDIPAGPGSCSPVTVRYAVPSGISRFRSTVFMTADGGCGSVYAYPSPYL